jgi:amino acid adenylation domain-containing protein
MPVISQAIPDSLTFWRENVAGVEPALSLPKGRQLLEGDVPCVGYCDLPLDNRLAKRFETLAAKSGLAVPELWLGAMFVLLYRCTRQQDLLIAQVPSAGSTDRLWGAETTGTRSTGEQLAKTPSRAPRLCRDVDCVRPVRLRISGDISVLDLARTLKDALNRSNPFGMLPRSLFHELTGNGGKGGSSSLVQFAFVAIDNQKWGGSWPPTGVEMEPLPYELGLIVYRSATGILLRFVFNELRYSISSVEWLARHYAQLLVSMECNPDTVLGDLAVVTDHEEVLLGQWSRATSHAVPSLLFHECFQLHVARKPDALAVVYDGGRWTFRELDERANQLAHHLQSLGAGPDVLIGVGMEPSPEMVVAAVAILKAGGALLFLDVAAPRERLEALVELAVPAIVLTKTRHRDKWQFVHPVLVMVDEGAPVLSGWPMTAPTNLVAPHNTGFVFVTSGSTGHPKIVLQPYGLCCAELPDDAGDRHLLKSGSGTSFTTAEVMAVTRGNTLFIAPEGGRQDLQRLVAFIGEHGITDVLLVPSALRGMLMLDDLSACRCLRTVDCIGEMISPDLKRLFFERIKADFVVSYGCTEARCATTGLIRAGDDTGYNDVGRTNPGMQVYVLDAECRLSPIEMPGEVYVGGRIAAGYLNDPVRTAEQFVPHPFDPTPGARLFRTGDLGRWLASGNLEILGRLDQQVKIRGFRIEPGEVEAVLCQHPAVKQAAVVARESQCGTKELVAYITSDAPLSGLGTLREQLRRKLPEAMVPARYVVLEEMPTTSNGKCDRRALPPPDERELVQGVAFVAPRDPTENMLAAIWTSLLGRDFVGLSDNFFDVGGDSLLAVELIAEVKRVFGRALPVATFLDSPTVEVMARNLRDDTGAWRWSSLVPIQALGSKPPLYFIHGWGGGVFGFVELARALGRDQASFGLQAAGFNEGKLVHTRLEDMAAHYAREIQSFQPQGPYYLGGFSAGGWIAYATAQELRRQGQQVAMLAMIDTITIPFLSWAHYARLVGPYFMDRFGFHLRNWMSNHDRGRYFAGRWTALKTHMSRNRKRSSQAAPGKATGIPVSNDAVDPYLRAVLS